MFRSFFLLTFCSLFLYACGDGLELKEQTDDLGYRSEFKQDPETGLRQGVAREYDPEGNLSIEEHYLDGELHGTRLLYAPTGQIVVEENYENGKFAGKYLNYDEHGELTIRGQYVAGAMAEDWYTFHTDGSVKEVVVFKDNAENGPFREWYADGKPKASGTYLNGDNEHGTLHLYAKSGGLERVMECNEGVCSTVWTPDSTSAAPAAPDMSQPAAPMEG